MGSQLRHMADNSFLKMNKTTMDQNDFLDNLSKEMDDINIKNDGHDEEAKSKLKECLKKTYVYITRNGNPTDWQVIGLAQAIIFYKENWLYACRCYIVETLVDNKKISKDPKQVEKNRKMAEGVNLKKLIYNL